MNNMNNMNDVNGRDNAATRPAILQLPQLCLQGALSCFQQACLLVVGGRAPEVEWLRKASEGRIVWAVDHGLDACLAAGIVPQRLIGDGDSAAPAAWHFAEKKGIPIEKFPPEKDDRHTACTQDCKRRWIPGSHCHRRIRRALRPRALHRDELRFYAAAVPARR